MNKTTLNFKFVVDGNDIVIGKIMNIIVCGGFVPAFTIIIDSRNMVINDSILNKKYDEVVIQDQNKTKLKRTFYDCKIVNVHTTETKYDNDFKEIIKSVELEFEAEL